MKRIGVDVGGTFTDLIYVDDQKGTVLVHKTPSTPADPSIATVDGITTLCEMAKIKPSDLDQVFHGTTVATNIVIEHNGANVGMITTEGYRDVLHIARHKKPMNFSSAGMTFLPSMCPQRFGKTWSSNWIAAAPAASNSCTVCTTCGTSP